MIIASSVTNEANDSRQMSPMLSEIKQVKNHLNVEEKTTAIMDAGYFNEPEILANKDRQEFEIIVAPKEESKNRRKSKAKSGEIFNISQFRKSDTKDEYICPANNRMRRGWERIERNGVESVVYVGLSCDNCSKRKQCTQSKTRPRHIAVGKNRQIIERYKSSMKEPWNKMLIKERKAIVEHPFGTIKHTLGLRQFLHRGLSNVKSEFKFVCFTYNFKRLINILKDQEKRQIFNSLINKESTA